MIRLRGLCFSYTVKGRTIPVLKDLDADFKRGRITAIVGPSGSGKTSLLRLACGLSRPVSGEILVDGDAGGRLRAKTALIFQDFGLLPWETVAGNAELGLEARGLAGRERRSRVDPVLKELGLSAFSSTFPSRLSGGMRQRVALARALVSDADLLLMDEPFSSLDAITRESLQDSLLETQRRHGTTILLVTHSIEEAAYLADEVYILAGRNPARLSGPYAMHRAGGSDPSRLGEDARPGRPPRSERRESQEFFADLSALREAFFSLEGESSRILVPGGSAGGDEEALKTRGSLSRLGLKLGKTAAAAGVLIALWQVLASLLSRPFLPSPLPVLARLAEGLADGGLWIHIWASLRRVLGALGAAGPLAWALGLFSGRNAKLDSLASPAVYLLHPLPKVAFLPILMLFLGLGDASKIALMGLVVFGQLFVGARDAAKAIPPSLLDTAHSLGAGPGFRFWKVIFPGSLPALFSSMRVALGSAMAVLFLSETFASMDGLGWYIMDAWSRVDYPAMYAAICALAGLGLGLYLALDLAEAASLRWRDVD